MAQESLRAFTPDLPPSGRVIRQRMLAKGDPAASCVLEVRLGARPDHRDFEPSRCLAKRRGIGDQMGHTTTRMTERYAHAAPDHLLEAAQRISREPRAVATPTDTRTDTSVAEEA